MQRIAKIFKNATFCENMYKMQHLAKYVKMQRFVKRYKNATFYKNTKKCNVLQKYVKMQRFAKICKNATFCKNIKHLVQTRHKRGPLGNNKGSKRNQKIACRNMSLQQKANKTLSKKRLSQLSRPLGRAQKKKTLAQKNACDNIPDKLGTKGCQNVVKKVPTSTFPTSRQQKTIKPRSKKRLWQHSRPLPEM